MLGLEECYRLIKPVDIGPVLGCMHLLEFEDSGGVCAQTTKSGSNAPIELRNLIVELGLGGYSARLFCRRLPPRVGIKAHVDLHTKGWAAKPWRRFQVPLVSHMNILMRWPNDNIEVHLAPGNLYEVRVDRLHEVVNNTDVARIHMQIDQVGATI